MRKTLAAVLLIALSGAGALLAEEPPFVTNARGLDRRNMDPSVSPCVDFYQYANGGWLSRNPVPADQRSWGMSAEMRERNYGLLREILEEAAAAEAAAGTTRRKAGDFWRTAMDTGKIEQAGLAPLAADLERLAKLRSSAEVGAWIAERHLEGSSTLFEMLVFQDFKDSQKYIVYVLQGGLGLPDRDYYTRTDEESAKLREKYTAHVAAMLRLLGDSPEEAQRSARDVLALETRFAAASLTNVELRDPASYYNIKTVAEADALTPRFSWSAYFRRLGLGGLGSFSYASPKFFAEMNAALSDVPLTAWKSYLRWHLIHDAASYLPERFVDEDFAFFGRTLQGSEQLLPRWKRVVDQASASLGEALGQVYVERAFPPATKARALEMIENLRGAIRERIRGLAWMSEETRKQALAKLETFRAKIGYPGQWRDYSALQVGRASYLANARAAAAFERRRNLNKLGKPIDRNEWMITPQTVDAYYSGVSNEIVFPAGIMQPPSFDGEMDDAVNYGAMGGVIGHEFMHGFDDEGSRFDAQGNMKSWWTDEDRRRFEARTARLVEQYNGFVAVGDLHVNGKLTLGENIGDLAGLTMSYHALQAALAGKERKPIDGFTPEQRFFLSWAQVWRRNARPEAVKLQVNTDPHSPSKFRVNGPVANMPEFAAAFGCKAGDPMVLPEEARAAIW